MRKFKRLAGNQFFRNKHFTFEIHVCLSARFLGNHLWNSDKTLWTFNSLFKLSEMLVLTEIPVHLRLSTRVHRKKLWFGNQWMSQFTLQKRWNLLRFRERVPMRLFAKFFWKYLSERDRFLWEYGAVFLKIARKGWKRWKLALLPKSQPNLNQKLDLFTTARNFQKKPCIPCKNGGKCKGNENYWNCECRPGFAGKTCEIDVKSCKSGPCLNGDCKDEYGDRFSCDCFKGFTGKFCESEVDDCQSVICYNQGICMDGRDSFACDCRNGFGGKFCQMKVQDCGNLVCEHRGVCSVGVNESPVCT